jgi:hypothetical protein
MRRLRSGRSNLVRISADIEECTSDRVLEFSLLREFLKIKVPATRGKVFLFEMFKLVGRVVYQEDVSNEKIQISDVIRIVVSVQTDAPCSSSVVRAPYNYASYA